VNQAIEKMIGGFRPHRSAAVPAPIPPSTRNISVTVPSNPASAALIEKLCWMLTSTNVRIVKSNASSTHAKKVARNAFHCSRDTWRYHGTATDDGGVAVSVIMRPRAFGAR
jgi:hypothetical protein